VPDIRVSFKALETVRCHFDELLREDDVGRCPVRC
jgi:hypothetical protein